MEKLHIAKVVALETLYVALISLTAGLVLGMALDKAMYLLIMRVLGFTLTLGFYISKQSMLSSLALFGFIFMLILLSSLRQLQASKPIDLLQSKNAGESEPKTKWLMALLGVACLGGGYYIAISITNPVAAIFAFFIAVLLVIAGTYLLFTAGSIAILKLLRKNKKYYYKTKHFTSVSGMLYRMKQNAVGLANICILSTAVLVLVSITSSLMIGIEDIIKTRFPYDLALYVTYQSDENSEQAAQTARDAIAAGGLMATDEVGYTYISFASVQDGDTFLVNEAGDVLNSMENVTNLFFMPLSQYNLITGEGAALDDGEILIYSNRGTYDFDTLKVFDREYKVAQHVDEFIRNGLLAANVAKTCTVVVKNMDEVNYLCAQQKAVYGEHASRVKTCYGFDLTGDNAQQTDVYNNIKIDNTSVESRAANRDGIMALYGGLFFVGVFLGLLFIMATVLIIYYKQISEGYDDKERFEIMQKVGMSHAEVKRSIHSQILTVFFMPLITAGVHTAFAFPMVSRILAVLNLTNTGLFMACTAVCFVVFAVLYAIIYGATAKTYYKIVSG